MAGWVVELRYPGAGGLRFDCETQLVGGGLLIEHGASELPRIEQPFVLVELYVEDERLLAVGAELVDLDELTIQLGLSAEACAAIEMRTQQQFSSVPADGNATPLVEFRSPAQSAAVAEEAKQTLAKDPHGELEKRIKLMSVGERMQIALHGGRE